MTADGPSGCRELNAFFKGLQPLKVQDYEATDYQRASLSTFRNSTSPRTRGMLTR